VVIIRQNTIQYRIWKKQQNEKLLKRRTKNKLRKKRYHNTHVYSSKINDCKDVNKENNQCGMITFHAPLNFSFVNNYDETSVFFKELINSIIKQDKIQKHIFIDISKIQELTVDALIYLLAIVTNRKEVYKGKTHIAGNIPLRPRIKKRFVDSGFYNYVNYVGENTHTNNNNNIEILSGENSDTSSAQKISNFVCEKANVTTRTCGFLYNMMIELMSNTFKHAYNDSEDEFLNSKWYCFAEYDDKQTITFIFLDTGRGIPDSVSKNKLEKITYKIPIIYNENYKYVVSALKGEDRTATGLVYRGKGLPKIRQFCETEKIKNVRIISHKADVVIKKDEISGRDVDTPLRGTMYHWQIDITSLKGER
jgi:hypothetical protein